MRLLAFCGLLGPLLSVTMLLVLGRLYPGYSHARQQISLLGAQGSPHALWFNLLVLGLPGCLVIAFAIGLHLDLEGRQDWFGPLLVALGGAGMAAAAIFRCDPGCVGGTPSSALHQRVSTGIACLAIAPVVIAPRLRADPRWRSYSTVSLAAGLAALLLGVAWGFSGELGLGSWEGLLQRGLAGLGLLWVFWMAFRLWRLHE